MPDAQTAPAAAPLEAPAASDVGQFVYHDLMTPDPAAARAFYTALVGWEASPRQVAGVAYIDLRAAGRPFGGIMPLDAAHGIPPHWVGYVAVDDVAAACARAAEAGGRVLLPTHAIPDGSGEFAVLQDPTGAVVSVLHLTTDHRPPPADVEGGPWWHELLTHDPDRAAAFYAHLFGWEARPDMTLPDGSPYYLFHHAGRVAGGMMRAPSGTPASMWQLYLTVADVDTAIARAAALGGAATWPAMDVPGVGRMGGLADPAGAMFAVGRAAAKA